MASNRIEEQDIPESNYTDPVEDEEEDFDSSMTLVEHLEELRWRILKSIIAIAVGFILALPVVLYQAWAFISPGLLPKEKKYAIPFIFAGLILCAVGITVGFFVLQYPVQWLITFASDSFAALITAGSYFTFVAFFLLAFGIVFEIPLVLTFLAQVDLISSQTLTRKRTASHIGMWIAATIITPGADIYSPIFLGVSMSFLYELSIIFIKLIKK